MILEKKEDTDEISELFTPEQKRKIQEFQLAAMSEILLPSPDMFDALDLTEAQKQEMEEIKKSLEPEWEETLEQIVNADMLFQSKLDEYERQLGVARTSVPSQTQMDAIQKYLTTNTESIRLRKETADKAKSFSTQFYPKMFDVLTDEQWMRLQNLIDNPPEYVKEYLEFQKKFRDKTEKKEEWMPGPNSWRPGDPIPEQYRQERNERQRLFPRSGE
jgi:Spy/CpxP family protein refolding chaperone